VDLPAALRAFHVRESLFRGMTGQPLGQYEILAKLGEGGMGEVFRAHDTRLDRDVAIKLLPARAATDAAARARLVREARLAASLNHPSICTVHDVGEADGRVYVAMELVGGESLANLIPKDGLAMDEALRYAGEIADALAHAHEHGVVHRDLKPVNVRVTPDGRVKVLDFGLATRRTTDIEDATRSAASLDSPGTVAGTLPYMAPEGLRGAMADPRGDVWSFGVLLHELVSGRRPFQGASGVDLTSAILRDTPPALPAHVPPGVAAIVERCLAKTPERRYSNGAELRAAVEAVRAGAAPGVDRPRSKAFVVSAVCVAVAVILAIAVFARAPWRAQPAAPNAGGVRALAVLPLENLSGDASDDYFADGLTEELIARLSKINGLSVTSRTSVVPYKKTQKTVHDIASALGVDAIVEGTVARSGDRVRVTARLLEASTERSLWTERYDRASADVLAIQAEVASAIGDAIRSNVSPQERRRLTAVPASNSAAYDLYLRGRFHASRESQEEIPQAVVLLEKAVAADPEFAPSHAELARAYSQYLFYVSPGDTAVQERAFVEIERALALDPELDTAHLARGLLLWQPMNHFPHERAIVAYRRAIELNPSSDEAHHQLGLLYLHVGLLDEGDREVKEALRLNPSNALAQFRLGVHALYRADYPKALDVFSRTPPAFQPPLVAFQLADTLFHLGRKSEAARTAADYLASSARDLGGMSTAMQAMLAADAGEADRVDALVAAAREKGKGYGHFHHTAFTLARAYALIGRTGDAIQWLRQAADDGYPCYPVFENDKTLDRIRGDQAFKEFLTAQRAGWERFKQLAR
jgi:TolB-like protein/Tfp pilus assembly protein PilF